MARTDRCETMAGAFRCDFTAGHDGPCETVARATRWTGPALMPADLARALARRDVAHEALAASLRQRLGSAERRAAHADAVAAMTHVVTPLASDGGDKQCPSLPIAAPRMPQDASHGLCRGMGPSDGSTPLGGAQ